MMRRTINVHSRALRFVPPFSRCCAGITAVRLVDDSRNAHFKKKAWIKYPSLRTDNRTYLIQSRHVSSLFAFQPADTTENIESHLETLVEKDGFAPLETYCAVLETLSNEKNTGGVPQRAEKWMNHLLEQIRNDNNLDDAQQELLLKCFNAIIWTWAHNNRENPLLCSTRAELWFDQLSKQEFLKADLTSFHGLLHAFSKGRSRERQLLESQAEKAEAILRSMQEKGVQINTETFNYVIRAWTRCRTEQATHNVMDLLREMEKLSRDSNLDSTLDSSVHPNTISYSMAMDAWANLAGIKARRHDQHPKQKNDEEENNDLSHLNGIYEVRQVEALLKYIQQLHDAGVPNVKPNTVVYNTYISAWTRISSPRNNDGELSPPLEAEKILRQMETKLVHSAPPDNTSYTKVILAWAKSFRSNAGSRASFWLDHLWRRHQELQHEAGSQEDTSLLPRVSTYNAVIQAWGNSGNPSEAEAVLQEMLEPRDDEDQHGVSPPRPNTESFSHVIFSWQRKGRGDKTSEACRHSMKWLDHLIELEKSQQTNQDDGLGSVTTTPEMFHGIIKTAVASQRKAVQPNLDLLDLAIDAFDKYRASRHNVTHGSYALLLQLGLDTLSSSAYTDARNTFIKQLAQDCCQDGLLSNVFVRTLANGNVYESGWTVKESAKMTHELFPPSIHKHKALPASWSRNIPQSYNLPTLEDLGRKNFNVQKR